MPNSFGSRLQHAWNAFLGLDPTKFITGYSGSSMRQDKTRLSYANRQSLITPIYNRIAADVANIKIEHVKLDLNGRYKEDVNSGLNSCLNLSANIDQTGRSFIQDVVISMLDEGCVAIVPVDTTLDPYRTNSFDISTMRVGKILEWYPEHIKVQLYNEKTGLKEDIVLPKSLCAIVENPFYLVMNEPNSTMQRLIQKINILDRLDEQSNSGKLDLIIQLPYVIKSDARKKQADLRRKEIEDQLNGSKYGIAYTDGTEKITQLNRSVENNLLSQIQYLTSMLYSQLGMPASVFDGTADDATMLNYYNRTIEPIVSAIVDEMKRKFLTKTARTQGQSIIFFRDPFKLVPVTQIADIADKFTRNEILSSNEVRQIIGYKPSDDPAADELRNKNLNQQGTDLQSNNSNEVEPNEENSQNDTDSIVNDLLDSLESNIDDIIQNYLDEEV